MPQWAGSCWYYLRYLDPTNDKHFLDPEIERYWMGSANGVEQAGGVDLYVGGVEQAGPHLRYTRFWHKILFDVGHVFTPEPFPLAPQVASELWEKLGHREAIDDTPFPIADPDALVQTQIGLPVTVNGKPRGEIIRVVVVPGKIVNFVVRSAPREERY